MLAFGAIVAATAGVAETTDDKVAEPASEPPMITLEVVGSHLRRADLETALPVQIITREAIDRSGATTLPALMARVSANVNAFNDQLGTGAYLSNDVAPRPGLSSINLRGIGDGSTLVLVNGRRVANYAFDGGSVDISAIPLAAIDRVEILKDGASAIYGTDAIAGVVNIVLRKDYRGAEVSGEGAWPGRPGGRQLTSSAFVGTGDLGKDGYNAFIGVSYQKDDALDASQRAFSRTGYRPDDGLFVVNSSSFPANIVTPDGELNPSFAAGCAPPYSVPFDTQCLYDPGAQANILPATERLTAYGRATFAISPSMQVFAEAGYARNDITFSIAPTPYFGPFSTSGAPFIYPAGGPYYPTAFADANGLSGDLALQGRILTAGNRIDDVVTEATRAVVGVEGSVGTWDVSSALVYSGTRETDSLAGGYLSEQGLRNALASGLVNPFGPSGPAGDALIHAAEVSGELRHASGSTWLADARATREFGRWFGQPAGLALGVEARHERLEDRYDPGALTGDVLTVFERSSASGQRTVFAGYAEAGLPLPASIEMQLAVRYDHYSDFGGTTNPKVALRWQPSRAFLARASWGTGFRAPTLYDLHTPETHRIAEGIEDPVRCPVTGSADDCFGSTTLLVGGNPDLQPETSTQVNAGIVWSPAPEYSLTLDYWHIAKRHTIGVLPIDAVLAPDSPFAATHLVRGPPDAAHPDLPGAITSIVSVNENLGSLVTSGYDVDALRRLPSTSLGRFSVHVNGTYVDRYALETSAGDTISAAGNSDYFPLPRWRHSLSIDWSDGAWSASLAQLYQDGYAEFDDRYDDGSRRRVGAYETYDLQGRYTGFRDWTLVAGIRNLFDRDPPFVQSGYSFAPGFDGTYAYDPRGRTWYMSATYAFH